MMRFVYFETTVSYNMVDRICIFGVVSVTESKDVLDWAG